MRLDLKMFAQVLMGRSVVAAAMCMGLCSIAMANTGSAESDLFAIDNRPPVLELLYPTGGEVFEPNAAITIVWTRRGIVGDVVVAFSGDGGATFADVNRVLDANSYVWQVPAVDSNQCLIAVRSALHPSVTARCEERFSVLMPPASVVGDPNAALATANVNGPAGVGVNTPVVDANLPVAEPGRAVAGPDEVPTEPNSVSIPPNPVVEPNLTVVEPNAGGAVDRTAVEPDLPGPPTDSVPVSLQAGGRPDPNAMIRVPGGSFEMGDHFGTWDADERPVHVVEISPLLVGATEVTNRQYGEYLNNALQAGRVAVQERIVCGAGRGEPYCNIREFDSWTQISFARNQFTVQPGKENHPMLEVSWYGAAAYCNWLSERQGLRPCYNLSNWDCDFAADGYRLPTEAEWEYAARGGLERSKYPWGNEEDPTKTNWWGSGDPFEKDPYPRTTPVGFYPPNGFGLYDMAGNVWEWCNDWYGLSYYDFKIKDNPRGPASGSARVTRGGSWILNPDRSRCSNRNFNYPHYRGLGLGFRVVRRAAP